MPEDIKEDLLEFSSEIYEHKDDLEELGDTLERLDKYMKQAVEQYK